jgi:hypothetical protein
MASKEIGTKSYTPTVDELLDGLASFLYDAYQHSKENTSDKIELEKGQIAENEGNS